ncbi:MAG: Ig-like domain-containing protein [Lachnospiraceae bacterium]|nr:Ig-like domain-containing protein [Lachnospiraceae bacterium]
MKQNGVTKFIFAAVICLLLVFGLSISGNRKAIAQEEGTDSAIATEEPTVSSSPTPVPTPIDITEVTINKTKTVIMAKKKVTLKLSGLPAADIPVTWTSTNPKVATVSDAGVVKGISKGTAVIEARVGTGIFRCTITVVSKMVKKDFSKFNGENFVSFCKRKGYNYGYAWVGQWKGKSKKKKTYRGIKIGASTTKVKNAYGEFTLNKCKKKDPFTKMKGLKKNKVKTYADMTYGKYRIRFYFNKKKKVVAIIYACNIGRIKKSALRQYI